MRGKAEDGQTKSPQQEYVYEDPRFEWRRLEDKNVTVYWHDRPEEFGKNVFEISTRALADQRNLYDTDLKFPVLIVIENTDEEFMS